MPPRRSGSRCCRASSKGRGSRAPRGSASAARAASTRRPEASAAVSRARPQLSVSGKLEWLVERRQEDRGERDRRGYRQPEAQQQQGEDREDGGHVAREGEIEDRPVARHRVERGGRQRHGDPALVELGVVAHPLGVAGAQRVVAAQLRCPAVPGRCARAPRRGPRPAARGSAPGRRARPASSVRGRRACPPPPAGPSAPARPRRRGSVRSCASHDLRAAQPGCNPPDG